MSDSSDNDYQPRPSGSSKHPKRKSRIVMRIEFDDSDETSSSSASGADDDIDEKPTCSRNLRTRNKKQTTKGDNLNNDNSDESQENIRRSLRTRRTNILNIKDDSEDYSSSGSEVIRLTKSRVKSKTVKKYVESEEEQDLKDLTAPANQQPKEDGGFTSDSSSNELLEKCPICLVTFRQQEIGSPSTCEHVFCAKCIEAWSKNVQTCPIDRIAFNRIIVRDTYENRKIVREIDVDLEKSHKEYLSESEFIVDEEFTNCEICSRPDREDVMLLCDSCNQGYHMDCLSPPLTSIPEGTWYCDNCVGSEEDDDVDEDINILFEDLRDMGISDAHLRVTEVQQPRILRTRENERIRAAVLRRTRSTRSHTETTVTAAQRTGQQRNSTVTTTTTTRTTRSRNVSKAPKRRRKRRRRARQRTYVVEYDLNNYDEKFAIKTSKKVIKRRRRKQRSKPKAEPRVRQTASRRLAEQMGVKQEPRYNSQTSGTGAGLSLMGNANDLEYFSDSDNGGIESQIEIGTGGHGAAVQTSVRISSYGPQRSRKNILLGRLKRGSAAIATPTINNDCNTNNADLLTSIMNIQNRWLNASRSLGNVHINSDGSLNLEESERQLEQRRNTTSSTTEPTPKFDNNKSTNSQATSTENQQNPVTTAVMQAPMYPQSGGTNTNFNNSGGGYNNRFNNSNNYRGNGHNYRHSTGGIMNNGNSAGNGGNNYNNMGGPGNFNYNNNTNYNNHNQNPNFSPFSMRFNQRNQQNNQRNNNNNQIQQPQVNQIQQPPVNQMPPRRNSTIENAFSGLPPPPIVGQIENQLFGGLPPAIGIMQPPPVQQLATNPPLSVGPPLLTVPPPPTPPSAVQLPWTNSLFQLSTDYGNEDDSNCPNFSVYSAESQELVKSAELPRQQQEIESSKEDDENEDLVQLDDDDDIPMPPDNQPVENSELYEPENPTEENDDDEDDENDNNNKENNNTEVNKSDDDSKSNSVCDNSATIIVYKNKVDNVKDNDDDESSISTNETVSRNNENIADIENDKYNPEEETESQSNSNLESINNLNEISNTDKTTEGSPKEMDIENEVNVEDGKKTQMSPSSTESEIKLPGNDMVVSSRKGVLDLYDDSDWEELDIDKPKEYMKQTDSKETKKGTEEQQAEIEKPDEIEDSTIAPDRSYTPCLDENNEPEENANTSPLKENTNKEVTPKPAEKEVNDENTPTVNNLVEIETELISEEEENVRGKNKRRNDKRDGNKEIFKKVSNKQKIRNYRSEKHFNKRGDKRRYSRSTSKSRSRSRSRSKSFSRSKSPRGRGRKRTRSPFYNRSNKENHNYRQNNRDWDGSGRNNMGKLHRQRPKRREMPRYDVRNIIGTQRVVKDRYGRDTSRQLRNSRSASRERRLHSYSRSRTTSLSPRRNRRSSFSMSPTPPGVHRISLSPRRFGSPPRHYHSPRRFTPPRQRARSASRLRSRSISPLPRMNNRKIIRHMRNVSPIMRSRSRIRSFSPSPRYTPRLSRSRSKSPFTAAKGKKKKTKDRKKKKNKKRALSLSPETNRRISRQQDPFIENAPPKKKRHIATKNKSPVDEQTWSPSPSPPPPLLNYERERENNISWTPPITSNRISQVTRDDYAPVLRRSSSILSKKDKRKRTKKKKKTEKRKDSTRKEKRRPRRTKTPEPAPSKEVFASGNNILVSVSFNKEAANQQPQQTTVVTLPPTREDLLTSRRISMDHVGTATGGKKRKEKSHKRKKIDAKPVAIIDLDRSPFQIHQEPTDVIILTDSEDGRENEREQRRERRQSIQSVNDNIDHRQQLTASTRASVQHEQTPPLERLETIMEESYELQQTGPKTPPEPPIVKFNINSKKQNKIRINPLHDEQELQSETESQERPEQEQHRQDVETIHTHNNQKIGPNTPPDSGPCSPDAYDPFEPTKSPSMSPRSPSPAPIDTSQNSISECGTDGISAQKHADEQRHSGERIVQQISGGASGGIAAQSTTMNPVELVMALMNTKVNNTQDLANKSNESQYTTSSHILSSGGHGSTHDDSMSGMREKADDGITVISNVLISTCVSQQSQHIPSISSPTPPVNKTSQVLKLPLPKVGGSVGSSSGVGLPAINNNVRNGTSDDIFNINDIESPYSPGSADYEDLFEPPPDTNSKRRTKRAAGKADIFDNLFGSSSPVNPLRLPTYTPSRKQKQNAYGATNKNKSKGKSNEDHLKMYDEMPNSAVDLQVKDRFLRKLNRQERVVEEVKLVLKPRFNKKQISKEDYKEIMRRAVPKICHSRSGEINPHKIKNLIDAYVKKFRAKHKKLTLLNTGQVSSAVKCAAYLKKL